MPNETIEPSGSHGPTLAGRVGRTAELWYRWWHAKVADTVDQAEIIATRREECSLNGRYLFMLAMSAGIAILGLLLSSPAVVIGAMLLSPLMDPIIGLGFALAIGDFRWLRQASRTLLVGAALAVALCAFIVLLSPLQTVTSEIAARTRPNLFDLLVALFSALAGGYALIRGHKGTIVGVAIATALMPPLAVVGFGLATLNWTVFSGAALLFITNLVTIALTAALMARFYGFSTVLSEKQTRFQTGLIVTAFVALAIPLGFALRTIGWEANASRQINSAVRAPFGTPSRVSQVDIDYQARPIKVTATVFTPRLRGDADEVAAKAIEEVIGAPVDIAITQYLVGTSATAQQQAELAAARERESAGLQQAQRLAARLAIIAGASEEDVLVDRDRRRALVTARPLEGATLATYRELERRIAEGERDWSIALRPPLLALPPVEVSDGEPTEAGLRSLGLAVWAAKRTGLPLRVSGSDAAAQAVIDVLAEQGVAATRVPGGGGETVALRWGAADAV